MYRSPSPAPSKTLSSLEMLLKPITGGLEAQNSHSRRTEHAAWSLAPQDWIMPKALFEAHPQLLLKIN